MPLGLPPHLLAALGAAWLPLHTHGTHNCALLTAASAAVHAAATASDRSGGGSWRSPARGSLAVACPTCAGLPRCVRRLSGLIAA